MNSGIFKGTLAVLTLAMLVMAATPAGADIIGMLGVLDDTANDGINPATGLAWAPGDTYRLAFYTSDKRDATSTDINDYNAFVQGVAAGSTAFPLLGSGTWKVVGSTATVSARENTGTDDTTPGVGEPIFVLDGTTMIAVDNADLWNGFGLRTGTVYYSPGYLNEEGAGDSGTNHGVNCATGSHFNGTIRTPLGGATVNWGSSNPNNGHRWAVRWDSGNPANNWSFYVLSDPLFVGSLPDPLFWQAATSGNWANPMWTTTPGTLENLVPTERTAMTIDQADTVVTVNSAVIPARSVDVGASTNSQLVVADTFALEVSRAVDVGAAGTLTVNGGLTSGTLNSTGTVNIGAGAGFSTGSGSVSSVVLAGNATIDVTGSTLDVASFTGTGGTLTKQGKGTLSAQSISAGAATDFQISGGTFQVIGSEPLGDRPVVLGGGTLKVLGTIANASFEDPVLAEDDWTWLDVPGWTQVGGDGPGVWNVTDSDFTPVNAPDGENVVYTENPASDVANGVGQVLPKTFAADTDYTLTAEVGNSWAYYWSGYSVQLLAGGTVIAEDNNTWVPPDYMLWDTSTVDYTYDPADAALVGQPLEIRLLNLGIDVDGRPDQTVGVEFDDVSLRVGGIDPDAAIDFSGVDLTVTETSTLDIAVPLDATFKSLAMHGGTFNTMGTAASIDLTATTFADGSAASGFNTGVPTLLGTTTADGVTPLVVTKTGSSDLILDAAATGLGSTTFDVQQGRLVGITTAAKGNPLDGAVLQVNGGEIVLAGPTTGDAVTFDNQVTVVDDGTLTAGPGGSGAPGPVDLTLGSAGSDAITLTSGTLVVQATDGYTLTVAGDVSGGGGINVSAGTVTLAQPVDVGKLAVGGGNLTTSQGGTIATSLDVSGTGSAEVSGVTVPVVTVDATGSITAATAMTVSDKIVMGGNKIISVSGGTFAAAGTFSNTDTDVRTLTLDVAGSTVTMGTPGGGEADLIYIPITNDADSEIDSAKTYTHALDFGNSPGTVNGVAFVQNFGDTDGTATLNTGSTSIPNQHGGDDNHNVADDVVSLFRDMRYNDADAEVILTGLTPDTWYDFRLYNRSWDGNGEPFDDRSQDFEYYIGDATVAADSVSLNEDDASADPPGLDVWNRAYAMSYVYQADAAGKITVKINQTGTGTYHNYGLTNELTSVGPASGLNLPNTDIVITADSTLAGLGNVTIGDLTVSPAVTLTVDTVEYSVNDANIGDGATVEGMLTVGGALNVGNGVGTMTVAPTGVLELLFGATFNAEVGLANLPSLAADKIVNTVVAGPQGAEGNILMSDAELTPKGVGRTNSALFSPSTPLTIIDNIAGGALEAPFDDVTTGPHGHIGEGAFLRGPVVYEKVGITTTEVKINVVVALEGDTDGDGLIGLDDWDTFRSNFGSSGTDWTEGNFDPWSEDTVDLDDWDRFRSRFGQTYPIDVAASAAAAVPEPGTIVMLVLATIAIVPIMRRRRA